MGTSKTIQAIEANQKLTIYKGSLMLSEILGWLNKYLALYESYDLPPHHSRVQYDFYCKFSFLSKLCALMSCNRVLFSNAISDIDLGSINKTVRCVNACQNLWIMLSDYFDCEWTKNESDVLMKSKYLGSTIRFDKTEPMVLFFFAYKDALKIIPSTFGIN